MACEYCNDYPKPFICDKRGRFIFVGTIIDKTRELHITVGDRIEDVPISSDFHVVNYCPMCGRDMREAEQMGNEVRMVTVEGVTERVDFTQVDSVEIDGVRFYSARILAQSRALVAAGGREGVRDGEQGREAQG